MTDHVELVDAHGKQRGVMEKAEAHRKGALHRAVSVFVFNDRGEILLQRRAEGKYHSSGLWSNTCCSHPSPGENPSATAVRRLREEMGISCSLEELYTFVYRAPVDNNMDEHEFDHVFTGVCAETPKPDVSEVMEWKWMAPADVAKAIDETPAQFTIWFQLIFKDVIKRMEEARPQ